VRKNVARDNYEPLLQQLVGAMKYNALVPEVVIKTLGILTGGGVHEKIPVTDTSPDTTTDTSEPMQVTIVTREKGKKTTGRPKGGRNWEMCHVVADEYTADISKLIHFSVYTKAKATLTFPQTQRGKFLLFAVRWVSPSGEQGKWSVVRMVIIP
jgi:hypothetical protein